MREYNIKMYLNEDLKRFLLRFLFPFRNHFRLLDINDRAKKNKVNLNYWKKSDNIGDALSPVIVEYMLQKKNLTLNTKVNGRKHLYAVGSVITSGIQDATIWGSGILNTKYTYRLYKRKLDIKAVRGPITHAILSDYGYNPPKNFGDPAILLPEIYMPTNQKKKHLYGLIMHIDDLIDYKRDDEPEVLFIDVRTSDYKFFIDQICACEMIISSSLHGIIVAESYSVPAILLKPKKDFLKYYDYYYSTGRTEIPFADTIEEAKKVNALPLPELAVLREGLKAAFPYDLFKYKINK